MTVAGFRVHDDGAGVVGIEHGAQSGEHGVGVHRRVAPRRDQQVALIGGEGRGGGNADGDADDRRRDIPPFQQAAALVEQRVEPRERTRRAYFARNGALRDAEEGCGRQLRNCRQLRRQGGGCQGGGGRGGLRALCGGPVCCVPLCRVVGRLGHVDMPAHLAADVVNGILTAGVEHERDGHGGRRTSVV